MKWRQRKYGKIPVKWKVLSGAFPHIKYKNRMRGMFYAPLMRFSFCVLPCFSGRARLRIGHGFGEPPAGFRVISGDSGEGKAARLSGERLPSDFSERKHPTDGPLGRSVERFSNPRSRKLPGDSGSCRNIPYSSRRRMASQPSASQCSSSPGSCTVLPLQSSRQGIPVGRPARWQERERVSFS